MNRGPGERAPFLAIALTLLAMGISGCGNLDPYRIGERSVARYLAVTVGPARTYSVHIDRKGSDLTGGYLSRITVGADDLQTASGVRLRRVDAELYGVRFDRRKKVVKSVDRSVFTAVLTEEAANAYLSRHNRGISDLSIEFEPDEVIVKAVPQVLGVGVPVTLRGQSQAEDGNLVRFLPDSMSVSRLNVPRSIARLVLKSVDPVFNLDDLKLPIYLDSAESEQNRMILKGSVRLP